MKDWYGGLQSGCNSAQSDFLLLKLSGRTSACRIESDYKPECGALPRRSVLPICSDEDMNQNSFPEVARPGALVASASQSGRICSGLSSVFFSFTGENLIFQGFIPSTR